jgi:hypothetical protein
MGYNGLNIEVFAKDRGNDLGYITKLANVFFKDRPPERDPHISFEAFIKGYEYAKWDERYVS